MSQYKTASIYISGYPSVVNHLEGLGVAEAYKFSLSTLGTLYWMGLSWGPFPNSQGRQPTI